MGSGSSIAAATSWLLHAGLAEGIAFQEPGTSCLSGLLHVPDYEPPLQLAIGFLVENPAWIGASKTGRGYLSCLFVVFIQAV